MQTLTDSKSPLRWRRLLVVLLAGVMILAACGDDDDDGGATTTEGDGGGSDLEGSIDVTGSSTVEPIVALQAEAFSGQNPNVQISVSGPGSGDGAAAGCAGEVPIWNMSRQIREEEISTCEDNGIEFVELRRGIDGITVITSTANDAIECLSFEELYALLSNESTGVNNWADANELSGELGGRTDFPDAELVITAPGEESGTFDSFIEIVLEDIYDTRVEEGAIEEDSDVVRPDYTASPNDNVIIDGVANNDTSLGWVGFAFADENSDVVKALEVDGGDGCIAPTPETIASAEFPISRFLYTYVNVEQAENNEAVVAFVDYMLSEEGLQYVTEAGYVDLAEGDLQQTADNWENRTTGVTF